MTQANMNAKEKEDEIRRLKKAFWLFASKLDEESTDASGPPDSVQPRAQMDRK